MPQKTALVTYHLRGSKKHITKRMRVEPTQGDAIRVLRRKHPNWVIEYIDFD